jgi:Ca2+-binding RTX toxin-like protein
MAFIPNAGDTTPPVVQPWTFSTQTVNLNGNYPGTFSVTARITDDLSGNAGEGYSSSPTQIRFRSPSKKQFVDVMLSGYQMVSGTPVDGTYTGIGRIAPMSEAGTWTVESLLAVDQVGNSKYYETPELRAMGYDTDIEVTYGGVSPTTPATPTTPTIPAVNTPSGPIPAPPGMVISGNNNSVVNGNNNFINYGTVTYTDSSTKNFVYTDNSVNYNYTTTSITTNRTYNGSSRNDSITGASTNDLLAGGGGNDVLTGGAGGDTLAGDVGNDKLYGGTGVNTFDGGTGKDSMYLTSDGQADILRELNRGDKVYIQGATRGGFSVGSVDGGLGIFSKGALEAVYTGQNTSESQLLGMLRGF